jgi:protein-S-isoprenylcysteine O-methyltransferase Ste14
MKRAVIFFYGVIAYLAFFVTILYAIGFVGDFLVPKTIDSGATSSPWSAVVINVCLLLIFVVQHTIMARPAFKREWTKIIPKAAERSTFVLLSSAILLFIFWQWHPITAGLWDIQGGVARYVLWAGFFFGWGIVFYSSFLVDHFDLFGLRQVYLNLRGIPYTHPALKTRSLYKHIRHPLMLGFIIAVWSAPTMTAGHLLFSFLITGYIFFGIAFEERDLRNILGVEYEKYRKETPMLLPLPRHHREKDGVSDERRPAT